MKTFSTGAYQGGMTLLEVLVALVILSLSGLAVMNTASEALRNQAHLEQKTIALWAASNQLVELKLTGSKLPAAWKDTEQDLGGKTWYLRYKTESTVNDGFKALDIEASEKKGGNALAYIRTYIAEK